ncbi:hypothetical protein N431DRAFT_475480 [Stipitochalara longipes BDJ]|nr:hypothetical protein N431DRAFT_475480 [Stipitochalara longipes BDJ]
MSTPQKNDTIAVPIYTQEADSALNDISWSQRFSTKTAKYYTVKAQNITRNNSNVLLFIQDRFYKDENSADFIGKIPGVKKEDGKWIITITDHFQYGQKNATGENRFIVLHDENNKLYQHRFLVTTIQGKAADWAKILADQFGASVIANNVNEAGRNFVGDYLHTY